MLTVIKKLDLYGAPVPTLNINGKSSVKTLVGGILSFLIMLTVFLFAALKLEELVLRKQPMLNKYELERALTVEDKFDTTTNF